MEPDKGVRRTDGYYRSPFNDNLIASGSDDGKVFIWQVPENFNLHTEEGADIVDVAPVAKFSGHGR